MRQTVTGAKRFSGMRPEIWEMRMDKGKKNKICGIAAVLGVTAAGVFYRKMRNSHHELLSSAGEEFLEGSFDGETGGKAGIWNHYPRPQMRRDSFYSLNGEWEMNGRRILVPFPPQSMLSGWKGRVGTHLEYVKYFQAPPMEEGMRLLLHFGAVDQVAEVYVNGHPAGRHEGGYLPFSFDITAYVRQGENRLVVKGKDSLSRHYPYGKQRKARGGMWYTPVSGIWQSVWMECVPQVYIAGLKVDADMRKVRISVRRSDEEEFRAGAGCNRKTAGRAGNIHPAKTFHAGESASSGNSVHGTTAGTVAGKGAVQGRKAQEGMTVTIRLHDGAKYMVRTDGTEVEIDLGEILRADGTRYQPLLWTVEYPYLYKMKISMGEDTVHSYFGLRTVEVKRIKGIPRVCLNGEPVFLQGVLDQGYFCDGLYLPAQEAEYQRDVLRMKALGMNLLRKHLKIEPECFYYYCDANGMLVMQDMVNSGFYSWIKDTALPTLGFCRKKDGRLRGGRRRKEFFARHMEDTIRHLHNHPCVIGYTIFNEGWGQFESDAMYRRARELDDTRLYDATSGWFSQSESDFDSQHIYFKRMAIPEDVPKPVLVSECGGYSLCVPGHFYAKYARYGYGSCRDEKELTKRVRKLYEETILPGIPEGLCGCIYTQLSDVEDEVNGFYTYDRKVCKVEPETMRQIAEQLADTLSASTQN